MAIGLVAIGLRALLCLVASLAAGTGVLDYARSADGFQYLAFARAWFGDASEFVANPAYHRLFPGYSLLVAALTWLGISVPVAALAPSWLACGGAAVLSARLFEDRRIGWAMAVLTPSYVYSGSLICTEAMCLLFSLAGLGLARRGRVAWAGVAFGFGAWFRPVAVFPMLGVLAATLVERPRRGWWRETFTVTLGAGLTLGALLVALQWRFGDALMTLRGNSEAYGGEILTWPFHSLVRTPLTTSVAAWKIVFVAVHLVIALGACFLVIRSLASTSAERRWVTVVAATWLVGNTIYVLCIGDVWGFHDFPRFLIPALPPLFWAWRELLPRRPATWIAIGLVSAAFAFIPAKRRLLELTPANSPEATAPASLGKKD